VQTTLANTDGPPSSPAQLQQSLIAGDAPAPASTGTGGFLNDQHVG